MPLTQDSMCMCVHACVCVCICCDNNLLKTSNMLSTNLYNQYPQEMLEINICL